MSSDFRGQGKRLLMQAFFLLAIFSLYWVLVGPSLGGPFVLDDYPNLQDLSTVKGVDDWSVYLSASDSSFLGRPLALVTFLLQSESWPADPAAFRVVNILIHLVNGLLVYWIALLVFPLLGVDKDRSWILALVLSALWLFLPIQSTAVFYIVQRMTLLAALFTLSGVLVFVWGVTRFAKGSDDLRVMVSTSFIVALCYLLGVASKENAVLMGGYIIALWVFLEGRGAVGSPKWRYWVAGFAILPLALVVGYLVVTGMWATGYGRREFDLSERLATQSVILWEYLGGILFPFFYDFSLFNDGHRVYRFADDFQPWLAGAGWLVAIVLAFRFRKAFPILLFALIWYLGGHALESTTIGLELYFEHRNYLPSLAPIALVVFFLSYLSTTKNDPYATGVGGLKGVAAGGIAIVYLFVMMFGIHAEAKAWESEMSLASASIERRPNSLRAYQKLASAYANQGDYVRSVVVLEHLEKKWPGRVGTDLHLRMLKCRDNRVKLHATGLGEEVVNADYDKTAIQALYDIMQLKWAGECGYLDLDDYRGMVSLLMANGNFRVDLPRLKTLLAASFAYQGSLDESLELLSGMADTQENVGQIALKVQVLMAMNRRQEALDYLERIATAGDVPLRNSAEAKRLLRTLSPEEG